MATSSGTTSGRKRSIDSLIGCLSVSQKQAQTLDAAFTALCWFLIPILKLDKN